MKLWRDKFLYKFLLVFGGEDGAILTGIVIVALALIVLGSLLPVLWPMLQATTGNITAISGTDSPTVFLKTMWPIALLVTGLGIVVAIIFYALRKFGILGGRGGKGF